MLPPYIHTFSSSKIAQVAGCRNLSIASWDDMALFNLLELILSFVLPWCTTFLLNSIIIIKYAISKARRQHHLNQSASQGDQAKITVRLLGISFTSLVLRGIKEFLVIYNILLPGDIGSSNRIFFTHYLPRLLVSIQLMEGIIHFCLFFAFTKEFREQMRKLFSSVCTKPPNTTRNETPDTPISLVPVSPTPEF